MLVVAGLILGQVNFFLVEAVANLSLHSKQLELGQDVLRYSNPDRIMTLSRPPGNWKWDPDGPPVQTRGVQEPKYRSRLRKELTFFNRSRSRTRSGYFYLEHETEQE